MKKRLFVLLPALLLILILTSCAGKKAATPDPSPAPVVVGFSQLGAESAWRIANTASMEPPKRPATG